MLACLRGAQQLPEQGNAHHGLGPLVAQGVEMGIGPLQLAGETQQFDQKTTPLRVQGMLLEFLAQGGNGLAQTPSFE